MLSMTMIKQNMDFTSHLQDKAGSLCCVPIERMVSMKNKINQKIIKNVVIDVLSIP